MTWKTLTAQCHTMDHLRGHSDMTKFALGDRVAYSAAWLRSVGEIAGELPQLRGTITALKPIGQRELATIDWDGPSKVMTCNLAHVGPNSRFCNC